MPTSSDDSNQFEQQAADAMLYQNLFNMTGDSIFVVDPDTYEIITANNNAARRLGYRRDALIGQNMRNIEIDLPDSENTGSSSWESHFSRTRYYECLHRHNDGSLIPVEVSSRLVQQGKQPVLLNMVRDITVRKALETEREQLIRDLDAYAHSVAHDLKNPIAVIMGYSEWLRGEWQDLEPDELSRLLDSIFQTSLKMQSIIEELLLLASIRKQDDIPRDAFDMGPVIRDVLLRFDKSIRDQQASLYVPDVWPTAYGYAPWVEEVMANYVSNALKYGGEPPVIELGADEGPDFIDFWVRDNGPGIPADMQESLFEQFTRIDQTRAEGHGLGLSIVKRIADRLGGSVFVRTQEGAGSTFYLRLPRSG